MNNICPKCGKKLTTEGCINHCDSNMNILISKYPMDKQDEIIFGIVDMGLKLDIIKDSLERILEIIKDIK